MGLASLVSTWSKDPSTQVGCVIVGPHKEIVSVGFNGFPRGIADNERLTDRPTKYKFILHAEENAFAFATRDLAGCTVYTTPMPPCTRCASNIIQRGIYRVVFPDCKDERLLEQWNINQSIDLLEEAGVLWNTI